MSAADKLLGTIDHLRKGSSSSALRQHLERRYPKIFTQLYHAEEDGFTLVGRDPLDVWLRPNDQDEGPQLNERDHDTQLAQIVADASRNIQALTVQERRFFVDSVISELEQREAERIFVSLEDAERLRETVDRAHEEVKRRALLEADVIGVTTTGFARESKMLRKLRSKVVVCEEAGEVLEAHVISAMMPGVEHFIQIGDHQQLRPQINTHTLSMESKTGLP